jgi:hypothetical protein
MSGPFALFFHTGLSVLHSHAACREKKKICPFQEWNSYSLINQTLAYCLYGRAISVPPTLL